MSLPYVRLQPNFTHVAASAIVVPHCPLDHMGVNIENQFSWREHPKIFILGQARFDMAQTSRDADTEDDDQVIQRNEDTATVLKVPATSTPIPRRALKKKNKASQADPESEDYDHIKSSQENQRPNLKAIRAHSARVLPSSYTQGS